MTPPQVVLLALSALAVVCHTADHACEAEVRSACPDRPGVDVAACLKDPSEHERATTISSECTDFIALNTACATEISQFCDEGFFTHDTVLCLSVWTDRGSLSKKCAGVLAWAAPQEEESAPTDELGLSEQDYEEKKRWQAERRERRGAAVEKLRAETDDLKGTARLDGETDRDYTQRMKEREELLKSREEQKKRERLLKAQKEREQRKAEGLPELEDPTVEERKKRRSASRIHKAEEESNWLPYTLGGLFVAYIFFNVLNWFGVGDSKSKKEDKDD